MAKKKGWLNMLKILFGRDEKSKSDKTEKRRLFLFGRLKSKKSLPKIAGSSGLIERTLSQVEKEQSRHALAVAIATAAAAEAAVAAAQAAAEVVRLRGTPLWQPRSDSKTREAAAITIQTAFRGYLARKALRALKALVKVQAIIRGRAVRRQTRTAFKSLQSLMKIQSQVQTMRTKMVENSRTTEETRKVHKQIKGIAKMKLETSAWKKWDGSPRSKQQVHALYKNRQEAALKRERAMDYACIHQDKRNGPRRTTSRGLDPEPESSYLNSRWSWLEQWVDSQPWRREAQEKDSLPKHECQIHASDVPVCLDSKYSAKIKEPHRHESPSLLSLRRKSFHIPTRSLIGDDESFSSSPAIPSYMVSTESTKAKARSISTPKQRLGSTDSGSDYNSPSKRRFSPLVSWNGDVSANNKVIKPHASQQRSPRLKGLSGPAKSYKSFKDLSVHSECSLPNWD